MKIITWSNQEEFLGLCTNEWQRNQSIRDFVQHHFPMKQLISLNQNLQLSRNIQSSIVNYLAAQKIEENKS